MGRSTCYPIAKIERKRWCGPHRGLTLVSTFINCCSDLWDPWTGCPKLAKAEMRFWASTWALFNKYSFRSDIICWS